MMHILKTLCLFKYRNDNPGFKCTYHVGHCYFHLSQTCYNYYQINIIIITSSFKLNVFSLISWTFLLYAFHNFITQAMMLFLTS